MRDTSRLIIHAGFPKCGSSSIQEALARRHADLKKRSFYLFDRDLSINFASAEPRMHPRAIVRAHLAREVSSLVPDVARKLKRLAEKRPGATAILSAEVLGNPQAQRLFQGIDDHAPTTIVLYVRPQFDWIPSAWKEWGLKTGKSLHDQLEACLKNNSPSFRRGIESWTQMAPKARIVVRILGQAVAENGGPAADFFKTIGLDEDVWRLERGRANPSLDYALLHILNKNPRLFRDHQDSHLTDWLTQTLPEKHLRTNIDMLSHDDQSRVAAHFFDENMHIIETYCSGPESNARNIYDAYFKPRKTDRAYADVQELEIVQRCLGIVLETLPKLGPPRRPPRRAIVRPPYWKIPRRIFRRLSGQD